MDRITLDAPGIQKLAQQLYALLAQGADVRAIQAANAQQAWGFDQPGVAGPSAAVPVTGNVVYTVGDAVVQGGMRPPSLLVLVFDSACGSGRYRIDGPPPTPAIGLQVPAGGIVLNIPGADNIKKFALMAEAGQTLTFARYLFS